MSRGGLIAAALAVVALGIGLAFWFGGGGGGGGGDGDGPGPNGELSKAELREATGLADRSVAALENENFDAAIEGFESLRDQFGDAQPFATRNLAVALLGRLSTETDDARRAALAARADAAIGKLAEQAGGAVPHVLAARLAETKGDAGERLAALERAREAAPDDPAVLAEIWKASEVGTDPERTRGDEALARAYELAPDNVFLLSKLLPRLARAEDPDVPAVVAEARELLTPLAESIRVRTRVDVLAFLDEVAAAAETGDWNRAATRAQQVHNVLQSEPLYRSDALRVDRHLLSLVVDVPEELRARAADPEEPPAIPVRFVSRPAVGIPRIDGAVAALAVADVDLDGRQDVVVLTVERLALYVQGKNAFEELATIDAAGYVGVVAVDLDTDAAPAVGPMAAEADPAVCQLADPDFALWGPAGVLVVENRATNDGPRELVAGEADNGLAGLRDVSACAPADFDHDGDLDLVVASKAGLSLLAARGDLTFEDVSARSMLPAGAGANASSILPVDLDGDLDLDFVVTAPVNSMGAAGWIENLRHGNLRWRPDDSCAVGEAIEVVDAPSARGWRLLALRGDTIAAHPLNKPSGADPLLAEPAATVGVFPSTQHVAGDFDNDGRLDVFAAGTNGALLVRPDSGGFTVGDVTIDDEAFGELSGTTALDAGDLDGDGDLDLVVATAGGIVLLDNEGGNANHWLRLSLRAQQIRDANEASSGRVNQHGIGSLVEVRVGPKWHRRIVRRTWTHLGLGPHDEADAVRILWTNGVPQNIVGAAADRVVCEVQSLKGSCPYLYTWDGERFVFCTDLLWAAPLGLQFADGVIADGRPWEHLLVQGDQLVPRDGHLELRITEELWEVGYLDAVELTAVDHPAEADVYTNEKVGPPSIAEHRLHTVTDPRMPVAIRDGYGRDLLPALAKRDEVYERTWRMRLRQGLVDENVLDIDLGDLGKLDDDARITLFLTGWVFPSDTSINVALSHDPRFPSPRPPSLQVPDANGAWLTVVPFTGFPGGKTKTIALDLSDVFLADDHRVRLVTNMEFAWDHAFFTVDDPPVETRETALELATAELRYRGFSRESLPPGFGPHEYDYDAVSNEPKWPPIEGGFTRYGDVRELVVEEDDRLVILGAGDELVLRFRVPVEPVPEGWRRDYVLRNVGWDKDGDMNTITGETVAPLPFRGMSRYPYAGGEEYPTSAVLESDRARHHVRRQPRGTFSSPRVGP